MVKVLLPPISQRLVDDSGQAVKEWYDKLKFLERLQPLSDIPPASASVTSIDTATGDLTLSYPLSRSSQALLAALTGSTVALGADVPLNNVLNYFDSASVTLGSGTWSVTATTTVEDITAGTFYFKLWDNTTVSASAALRIPASAINAVSLSAVITNPAAAVKVSVRNITATSGNIRFNTTGNSKDSHITAVRIA